MDCHAALLAYRSTMAKMEDEVYRPLAHHCIKGDVTLHAATDGAYADRAPPHQDRVEASRSVARTAHDAATVSASTSKFPPPPAAPKRS